MQRIIDFVSGKLTYEEFEEMFTVDSSIWSVAQTLLTPEIMNDNTHPFWTKSNRYRLESNNYSIRLACLAFGFDSAGKVITHRMLGELVSYQYPDVILRDPPENSITDLRDKLGMEYLGGTEVDALIQDVLCRKTEKISVAKFTPHSYPRWIQEPEWPMGKKCPMMFIKQQRTGELVEFIFQDVDTKEQRIVKQYY